MQNVETLREIKPKAESSNGVGNLNPTEVGWMTKAESKLSEKVELSKGTLWLLATGFILLQLVLNYGGSLMGWARDDQSKVKDIQSIQVGQDKTTQAIERIEAKFERLDERLRAQELQDAKIQGFKAGVAETQSDGETK